jgi:tetratricopeptide (TPR) repeat protein
VSGPRAWRLAAAALAVAGVTLAGAACAADANDLQRAAAAFRAKLQADPNRPDLRAQLGETLESLGDTAGAMAEYDKAIHGPGDSHRALIDRGQLLIRQSRFDDGRKDFDRALSQNPRDVEALAARGHSWVAQGKGKKAPAALADFNAALAIKPNDSTALNARGGFYLAELKPELALADFNKALAANPDDDAVLFNRAVAFKQLDRYDAALRDLNAVLRLTPGDPMTLASKGDCYRQLGDLLLAREFYDAALKADPRIAAAWEARGEIRAVLGDGPGGVADKAQARKLDPAIDSPS